MIQVVSIPKGAIMRARCQRGMDLMAIVSIPKGAIMSALFSSLSARYKVSIPKGAIMRKCNPSKV